MIGRCFGDDCGSGRVNRYRKLNASLLLANMHNTITYVSGDISSWPNLTVRRIASIRRVSEAESTLRN